MVETRPKVRDELGVVEFGGETVVYDPVLLDVHYLNASAGVVLSLCDGTATIEDTAAEIADAYEAPAAAVEADVRAAVEDFERRGLLESGELAAAVAAGAPADERPKLHLYVPPSDWLEKLDRLGWAVQRSYEIGVTELGIRTNSVEFGEWLGQHLARFETSREQPAYYSVLVADDRLPGKRFHILYADTRPVVRTTSLAALRLGLVRELETCLFHERDDSAYTMTPLCSVGGVHGALPPGTSFLMSSLGRDVDRAGLLLPLEPAIAIDLDSALATPIRPLLDVPDEAFGSLPHNGARELGVVERPVAVDVLFSIGESEELLRPVSKGVALYRLAHYAANLPRLGRRGFEALGRVVAGADCVEVRADRRRVMLDGIVTALRARA